MTYILFAVTAVATGLTARLIPTMLDDSEDENFSLLDNKPLGVLLTVWAVEFALVFVVSA